MRKLVISLLLASAAAAPAIADPQDSSDRPHHEHQQAQDNRQQAHEQRQQARQERQQAAPDRPSFGGAGRGEQMRMERQDMAARPDRDRGTFRQQYQGGGSFRGQGGAYGGQRDAYVQQQQAYAEQRQQRARGGRDWRQSGGNGYYQGSRDRNYQQNYQRSQQWDGNRDGDHHWDRDGRNGNNAHWNRDWRNDQRYDWQRYRDRHRSNFHVGLYVDPFGWGYRSFNVGYRMYPAYYGNRYWIDPSMYDLPYPPPGAAWVRYFNDAVLVDTYSGTVLDVIPSFFW